MGAGRVSTISTSGCHAHPSTGCHYPPPRSSGTELLRVTGSSTSIRTGTLCGCRIGVRQSRLSCISRPRFSIQMTATMAMASDPALRMTVWYTQVAAQDIGQRNEAADNREPPDLDPQVKGQQRLYQGVRREIQVSQHVCETKAMHQSETEGYHPKSPGNDRNDVVERGDDNAGCNGGLDQPRRHREEAERCQRQGDRMGHAEGGDDLQDIPEGRAELAAACQPRIHRARSTAGSSRLIRNRM